MSSHGYGVLCTYDTNVLCTRNQLSRAHHIWLEVGHYTNNTLRYIDVDKMHDYLGDRMCNSLPALHIFTGSDYTSAFNTKGKVKPLKLLQPSTRKAR